MRQMRSTGRVQPIDACLRDTLRTQPADPVVLGALSWLRFGDWQPLRGTEGGKQAFAEARALALRAYESGPNSSENGRESCGARGCQTVEYSGVAVSLKKKRTRQ